MTLEEKIKEAFVTLESEYSVKECCGYAVGGNTPEDEPQCCGQPDLYVRSDQALEAILSLLPNTGERDKALEEAAINNLKSRLDTRLNNWLCEMKPDHDDSIVGFNEAWDIVNKVFKDIRALKSTPKPVGEDVVHAVCEHIRTDGECKKCPGTETVVNYGEGKRMCRALAEDVVAVVRANLLRKE